MDDSGNPEFNELKSYPVLMDEDLDRYLKTEVLQFYVFDYKEEQMDAYLGKARVSLLSLSRDQEASGEILLEFSSAKIKRNNYDGGLDGYICVEGGSVFCSGSEGACDCKLCEEDDPGSVLHFMMPLSLHGQLQLVLHFHFKTPLLYVRLLPWYTHVCLEIIRRGTEFKQFYYTYAQYRAPWVSSQSLTVYFLQSTFLKANRGV